MGLLPFWSTLFVSFPEELLIVIITSAAAGYKEVFNFKSINNVLKLLVSTSLMVLCSIIVQFLIPSFTIGFMVQSVIFFTIIISVFRYNAVSCILGFLLSSAVIIISEALFASMIIKLMNISELDVRSNSIYLFLFSIPDRLMQILTMIVIAKVRKISLRITKLSIDEVVPLILYCIMTISSMFCVEVSIWNKSNSVNSTVFLILAVLITVLFSSWLIYKIFVVKKNSMMKDKMHEIELEHVKQLLAEGKTDYVIELIELTLREKALFKSN
jgi:hypothetical protein